MDMLVDGVDGWMVEYGRVSYGIGCQEGRKKGGKAG